MNSDQDDNNVAVSHDSDVVATLDEKQEFGHHTSSGTYHCIFFVRSVHFSPKLCDFDCETRNFASFLETAFLVWSNSPDCHETQNFACLFVISLVRGCLIKMFALVVRTHVRFMNVVQPLSKYSPVSRSALTAVKLRQLNAGAT